MNEAGRACLAANLQLAEDLAAEVVRLEGKDKLAAIRAFATEHRLSQLVVAREPRRRFSPSRGFAQRRQDGVDLDVHLVTPRPK
jgi:K+-sensing histidine kinase KdpD